MSSARELLEVALAEDGYLEKRSNYLLDEKTDNAGNANFTKYARDLDALGDFYNGPKNGYPWCDVFVDWCFFKAFGEAEALRLTCQPKGSAGAGVTYSAQYYRDLDRFGTEPRIGAQIFFGTPSAGTHTGLVYDFDDNFVYTIEGNTGSGSGVIANGGCVRKKKYSRNFYKIYGYGYPDFTEEDESLPDPEDGYEAGSIKLVRPSYFYSVKLPLLKPGMTDPAAEAVSKLLGMRPVTGIMNEELVTRVKDFQLVNGLEPDGEVGGLTWEALLS